MHPYPSLIRCDTFNHKTKPNHRKKNHTMTSEPTHTPGPWAIGQHATPDYAPQYGVYAERGDDRDLATVKGGNAEANARIIAAAPELFELALRCQGYFLKVGGKYNGLYKELTSVLSDITNH